MRKNKKDKKQDINYLDLIPETNQSIRWHRDLKQRIILEIENKGMFNTIAQKVFGKPRFSKVHLDEMGTFIWPEIDGAKTVQELALLVNFWDFHSGIEILRTFQDRNSGNCCKK